jgi:serine/threonine protein kinase
MHQLLRNMKYMYSKNLIHRDIKPDNFLMGLAESSSIVHTIDFGLSKKYRNA